MAGSVSLRYIGSYNFQTFYHLSFLPLHLKTYTTLQFEEITRRRVNGQFLFISKTAIYQNLYRDLSVRYLSP